MAANRTGRNIVANLAASGYGLLLSIAAIPVYLRLIGIESMGLITFHVTLSAVLFIVQGGLSTAIGREVARLDHEAGSRARIRGLLRTVRPVYWGFGAIVGLALALSSGAVASTWLQGTQLDAATIRASLLLLALSVALQTPMGLYLGVLDALQHQAQRAALTAAHVSLSVFGAIALLSWGPRSVVSYFAWYAACAAVFLVVLVVAVGRGLPVDGASAEPAPPNRFFSEQGRYIAGSIGIAVSTILLLQIEKLVLSGVVTLDQLGYYGIASTLALALYRVVEPVNAALWPRINVLTHAGAADADRLALQRLYGRGLVVAAFLLLPPAAALVVHADVVLLGWTRSPEVAATTGPVLRLLVIGATVHILSQLALIVRMAGDRLRYSLIVNAACLLTVAIGSYWAAHHFGIHAAAAVWAGVMSLNGLLQLARTHQLLFGTGLRAGAWLARLAALLGPALVGQWLAGLLLDGSAPLRDLFVVGAGVGLAYLACALLLPEPRQFATEWLHARRAADAPAAPAPPP